MSERDELVVELRLRSHSRPLPAGQCKPGAYLLVKGNGSRNCPH